MKYTAEGLYEFVMTESSLRCDNCHEEGTTFMNDYAEEHFFKKGWRATKSKVYCPTCAKKKLKSI